MTLVIVDYDSGNIASVLNMVRRYDPKAIVSSRPEDVFAASKLIIPGVGSFDHGVRQLTSHGLFEPIRARAAAGAPVLGICLGMQLLGTKSEEGDQTGLALLPVAFRRFSFPSRTSLRVPHMGWNEVQVARANPLLANGGEEQRFYFTHSYHAVCERSEDTVASAEYGYAFPAAIGRDNVFGVQFHPEKSHRFGMALIKNFVAL